MAKVQRRLIGWDVFVNGKWADTVFYIPEMDADDVKASLVGKGEYPPTITVRIAQ